MTDPIPETRGLGVGVRAPILKNKRRIGVGNAVIRGVAGIEGGAPSRGVLQPDYRFDNGHDNGFVDNGFDNGINSNGKYMYAFRLNIIEILFRNFSKFN